MLRLTASTRPTRTARLGAAVLGLALAGCGAETSDDGIDDGKADDPGGYGSGGEPVRVSGSTDFALGCEGPDDGGRLFEPSAPSGPTLTVS